MRTSRGGRAGCWGAVAVAVAAMLSSAASHGQALVEVVEAERSGRCATVAIPAGADIESQVATARLARCLFDDGGFDRAREALAALDEMQRRHAVNLDDLEWLPEIRARGALHAGDAARACAMFEAIVERDGARRTATGIRARHIYYRGLAFEACGRIDDAQESYRVLLHDFPGSEYASRAQLAVEIGGRSRAQYMAMAENALAARHYAAAERLLTLAACGNEVCPPRAAAASGDRDRYEAAYQLGFLLYRFRREHVVRALPWLETVADLGGPRRADARYYYARAVTRLERYDEARRAWNDFARRHPEDSRVLEARYRAAALFVEERLFDEAVDPLRSVLNDPRLATYHADTRWWLGWAHRQLGDCVAAIDVWRDGHDGARGRERAAYWSAVCQAELGERAAARRVWESMRSADPWSYYGLLSSRRLGLPLVPGIEQRPDPTATRDALSPVGDPAFAAADLGLATEARLLGRASLVGDGLSDPSPRWRLAVFADPAEWVRWRAQARAHASSVPTDGATLLAWQLANPEFYAATVRAEADRAGVPASMIWAVMQVESAYDVFALSHSDAMGLMQVIPQTAIAIAERLGERYVDGMLFEPYHAIRYGAWYLGALTRKFSDQPAVAIAAYNAGPVAMETWVRRSDGEAFDAFVEQIAYDQARNYLKRVLPLIARYEIASGSFELLNSATLGGLLPETVSGTFTDEVTF